MKTLAWGILGTGRIASTFAKGVAASQTGRVVAVGSRTSESAQKFGQEHDISNRHGSYDALLQDPEVQAVYISTPHPQHAEWSIKSADAGKHVLCEKPIGLNKPQAMAIVEAAARNDVFLMEAFMYRCHPQTAKLVELIKSGAIGEVRVMQIAFAFNAGPNLESRLMNPELAGGGILDVGCYCASMARLIAGAAHGKPFEDPLKVQATGHIGPSGVDEWTVAILKFEGDLVAQLSTGVQVNQENTVRIYGSTGHIVVPSPWFCGPTDGKIKILVHQGKEVREEIIETSEGIYSIEADTVAAHIEARQAPSPAMSWDDSLGNMKTLDQWRAAIGLSYPQEKPEAMTRPVSGRSLAVRPDNTMKYGRVAGVDKKVSRLVLGTMLEGAVDNTTHAFALFDEWVESGGTAFDTARIYVDGKSEGILGQWMQARGVRDDVFVIGKGAHTPYCDPENLTSQLLESLEEMQTDHVDLYMMHRDNLEIPVGEFVDVLNEHRRAGRMKSFGGSNWSLKRVQEANTYAQSKGLTGFSAVSNNFSLARMVEPIWDGSIATSDADSRAWLTEHQMPNFAWSSQARGFFARGERGFTSDKELARCWYSDDNFERLARVRTMAKAKGVSPINIAAAYVLCQSFPSFALIGPRALSEIRTAMPALQIELSPAEVRFLNLED